MKKIDKKFLTRDFKKQISKNLRELEEDFFTLHDYATEGEEVQNILLFNDVFEMEIAKAKRGMQKLSLAVIKIDSFGVLKKAHGEKVVEEILTEISEALEFDLRKSFTRIRANI